MTICPFCSQDNIEGTDQCDQCGQPLDDLHLTDPESLVERGLLTDRVVSLNPRTPRVVQRETTVAEVLQLLVDNKIGCVLIVDEAQHPVGIFSERDAVVRLGVDVAQHLQSPISDFMTPSPQTLRADAKVAFAVQRMDVGGYRHVPIVDQADGLTGVISVRNILQYLTERAS